MVAFVGRLDIPKGIPFLMDSWDRYRAETPEADLRLVIAGGGPLKDQVVACAASRPSVEAVGLLNSQDCAALIARARAIILPSQCEETFGLVVVEAMAGGTPPVAPAHGPFPELIRDGVDGVLFKPGSSEALAEVLRDIDADSSRYERYGNAGRDTYEQRFDPGDNIEQLLEIYRFAVGNPVFGRRDSPEVVSHVVAKP
jgi:glycosyltransferase involved in cell wall biosynthesis